MRSAPQPPSPPALTIAIASEAGQAPAMGAIRIGTRRLNASQNSAARASAGCCDMAAKDYKTNEVCARETLVTEERLESHGLRRDAAQSLAPRRRRQAKSFAACPPGIRDELAQHHRAEPGKGRRA